MKKMTFNDLVMLARKEAAPRVDVADSVIASLAAVGAQTDVYRPYLWVSVASAAVAACIAIAATVAWQSQDSVNEMLTYISWVQL